MKYLAALIIALIGSLARAADIIAPDVNPPNALVRCTTDAQGSAFAWLVVGSDGFIDHEANGGRMVFAAPPGRYYVAVFVITPQGFDRGDKTVTIGPPQPTPTPVPPVPPIPVSEGFRVLILEETADRGRLPRGQLDAILSPKLRDYLSLKTVREPDGKTPGYRIWDDDFTEAQVGRVGADWLTLYKRAKADSAAAGNKLPWIIAVNKAEAASQAFPENEAALLELVKKYGGGD